MAFEDSEEKKISRYKRKHLLKQSKMKRKVRQSQRRIKKFRGFLRFAMTIFLIFFTYSLLKSPHWYLPQNTFDSTNSQALEIVNNKIVPSYKILAALRRTEVPNVPIYLAKTEEMKANIKQLDPVDNVYIRRFWHPARLQIIVIEKEPMLTISPSENVPPIAFFARDGKLIGRDYMPLPGDCKTYLILSYGAKGDDYRHWDTKRVKMLEHIARAVEANADEPVLYVDYRDTNDMYVKIETVLIRLGQMDDSILDRIKRIPSILPQVKMLDKKIKYVDLRWDDANFIKLEE